jgi:hypothetical protein
VYVHKRGQVVIFHIIGSLLDATPVGQRLFGSVTASGEIAYLS